MKIIVARWLKLAPGLLALRLLTLGLFTVMAGTPVAAQENTPALEYSGNHLEPGAEHAGQLADFHPQMSDGTHADCFQLRPQAGNEYTVTLRSDVFDSFLLVGVGSCSEVLIQLENDDFEDEGHDSQVIFAAEYDLYSVYVNTYNPGTTGAYTLIVEARLLPMAPAAD